MLKHFRSGSKRIRTLWWILTIGTVVTFIGGFIFIFGSGVGDKDQATSAPSVVGTVGGASISQAELAAATQTALAQYQAQYGSTPTGRDAAILHEQVWNNLLTERAIEAEAKRLGVTVSDPEVVFAIKNTPPPDIAQTPALMTNGRFDSQKWEQLLADPARNWSWLEDRLRRSLPGQRLEERVIAGVKISEPELKRLYDLQYQKTVATVALLPLDMAAMDATRLNDAALKAYYEAHKADFAGPEQAQTDVVSIPVPFVAPNSALPGSGAAQYRVSVRDAAQNETVSPGTFSFTFDYFTCNQARATNTAANAPTPSVHTTISNAAVNCSSCHGPFNAAGTPAGTFIPVPRTTATYWCRRP